MATLGACYQVANISHTHGWWSPGNKDGTKPPCDCGRKPPVARRRGKHTMPSGKPGKGELIPAAHPPLSLSSLPQGLSTETQTHCEVPSVLEAADSWGGREEPPSFLPQNIKSQGA